MTMIVSWIGVDTHGPASAYMVSDSRISWNNNIKYDCAKKIFAFNNSADIIGYCGDVIFPSIILSQIVELADLGLLFHKDDESTKKWNIINKKIIESFNKYPSMQLPITNVIILYITKNIKNEFSFFTLSWDKLKKRWHGTIEKTPKQSGVVQIYGSGKKQFLENYERYNLGKNKNTSRNVFHCFCDTLFSNTTNKTIGGMPQLAGIIRKSNTCARKYGFIFNKKRYLYGVEITNLTNFNYVFWINDLFENYDGEKMKKIPNAQEQPNSLKKY